MLPIITRRRRKDRLYTGEKNETTDLNFFTAFSHPDGV